MDWRTCEKKWGDPKRRKKLMRSVKPNGETKVEVNKKAGHRPTRPANVVKKLKWGVLSNR